MGDDVVDIRFRHTQGDVGPFKISVATTIQGLKDKLMIEWPTEGPLQAEAPNSTADIRLILSGKFLENNGTVDDLRPMMGEIDPDTIITLHTIIRPFADTKSKGSEKESKQGCSCCLQ